MPAPRGACLAHGGTQYAFVEGMRFYLLYMSHHVNNCLEKAPVCKHLADNGGDMWAGGSQGRSIGTWACL